jgi:putative transposase
MKDHQPLLQPGCYYHIYNHAVGKENLFERNEDYAYFLNKMKAHLLPVTEVLSYCLMPNHFHMIVRIKTEDRMDAGVKNKSHRTGPDQPLEAEERVLMTEISKRYSNFFNTYAKHYNFMKSRTGTLFKRTFRRKQIEDMKYLRRLVCYVHQNPLTAGFSSIDGWKYSSYGSLISDKETALIRDHVLDLFGGKDSFIECHRQLEEIDLD